MRATIVVLSIAGALAVGPPARAESAGSEPPNAAVLERGAPRAYEVEGRVRDVDATTGRLVVDSADGVMRLRFPPAALRGLAPGEPVVARVAIGKTIHGTSTEGAGSFATDPETGSPPVRPPAAPRPADR
jgi:hypothetical protein